MGCLISSYFYSVGEEPDLWKCVCEHAGPVWMWPYSGVAVCGRSSGVFSSAGGLVTGLQLGRAASWCVSLGQSSCRSLFHRWGRWRASCHCVCACGRSGCRPGGTLCCRWNTWTVSLRCGSACGSCSFLEGETRFCLHQNWTDQQKSSPDLKIQSGLQSIHQSSFGAYWVQWADLQWAEAASRGRARSGSSGSPGGIKLDFWTNLRLFVSLLRNRRQAWILADDGRKILMFLYFGGITDEVLMWKHVRFRWWSWIQTHLSDGILSRRTHTRTACIPRGCACACWAWSCGWRLSRTGYICAVFPASKQKWYFSNLVFWKRTDVQRDSPQ